MTSFTSLVCFTGLFLSFPFCLTVSFFSFSFCSFQVFSPSSLSQPKRPYHHTGKMVIIWRLAIDLPSKGVRQPRLRPRHHGCLLHCGYPDQCSRLLGQALAEAERAIDLAPTEQERRQLGTWRAGLG